MDPNWVRLRPRIRTRIQGGLIGPQKRKTKREEIFMVEELCGKLEASFGAWTSFLDVLRRNMMCGALWLKKKFLTNFLQILSTKNMVRIGQSLDADSSKQRSGFAPDSAKPRSAFSKIPSWVTVILSYGLDTSYPELRVKFFLVLTALLSRSLQLFIS
jgi:hypothetical protein